MFFLTLEGSRIQAPVTIHRASHSTQKQGVSPSSRLMQVDVSTDRQGGGAPLRNARLIRGQGEGDDA